MIDVVTHSPGKKNNLCEMTKRLRVCVCVALREIREAESEYKGLLQQLTWARLSLDVAL